MQDLIRLTGKTAIVTGGALGIGYAIAYRLAEADANVVVADVDGEAAETAAQSLKEAGFEATAAETDVADESDVERMVRASVERYGGIDILVNNAGVYPNILVMNMNTSDFSRVLGVNLIGVFLCWLGDRRCPRVLGGRCPAVVDVWRQGWTKFVQFLDTAYRSTPHPFLGLAAVVHGGLLASATDARATMGMVRAVC